MNRRDFLKKGLGTAGMALVPGMPLRAAKEEVAKYKGLFSTYKMLYRGLDSLYRPLKKRVGELLEDIEGRKRLVQFWQRHGMNLQEERICLLKDLEERNKEIRRLKIKNAISEICSEILDRRNIERKKEVDRLTARSSVLWHKQNFWQTAYNHEHNHNDWPQECLDLEIKIADVMHERWASAHRDMIWFRDYAHEINHWWEERNKAQEQEIERLKKVEARTRCVERAYEVLWNANRALCEKYAALVLNQPGDRVMQWGYSVGEDEYSDGKTRIELTDGKTTIDLSDGHRTKQWISSYPPYSIGEKHVFTNAVYAIPLDKVSLGLKPAPPAGIVEGKHVGARCLCLDTVDLPDGCKSLRWLTFRHDEKGAVTTYVDGKHQECKECSTCQEVLTSWAHINDLPDGPCTVLDYGNLEDLPDADFTADADIVVRLPVSGRIIEKPKVRSN